MVFEHRGEHRLWTGGRLLALVLLALCVGCCGCALSRGGRGGDRRAVQGHRHGPQCTALCNDGTSGAGVWRAGYRWTTWRPLLTECDGIDSPLVVPAAPIPTMDEELPMPVPAAVPFQDDPPEAADSSAGVDWERLLPQTMPVMRAVGSQSHVLPHALPEPPANVRPEVQRRLLPATVEATDDPFESDTHRDPREAATMPAAYQPLAWAPTQRRGLRFKEKLRVAQ